MEKVLGQGLLLVAILAGSLFGLNQVDWMELFKVEQKREETAEKLGEIFWESYRKAEKESTDTYIYKTVDSLLSEICKANSIDRETIQLHILEKDEVNAFVLPGRHMVVYTGLIADAEKQEEICGVIGHELAHMELNHVMRKLVKELGFSTLVAMTTGSNSPEVITRTAYMLSSTAFDRSYEKEADMRAVDYLIEANVDPAPFADFLFKMSQHDGHMSEYQSWLSTHPESEERAKYVVDYIKGRKVDKKQVISTSGWDKLKGRVQLPE